MKANSLKGLAKFCAAISIAAVSISAAAATAASYPAKPVRIVVAASAGSNPDLIARIYAQKLGELYSQSFYVENKPGAGGNIGLGYASKLPPDGYSLVIGALGNLAISPSVYTRLSYDAKKDFTPVAQFVESPLVLAVATSSPIRTFEDLIKQAKAKPSKLTFASAGNGTGMHLAGEYLNAAAGIKLMHIPFSSTSAAVISVASGEVDVVFGNQAGVWPLVSSGKLRALAVTSKKRLSNHPDMPALEEKLKNFEIYDWTGLLAPAGTPEKIIDDLHTKIMKIQAMPDVRHQLEMSGFLPVESTRDEFRKFIDSERQKWGGVAKRVNIKLD